MASEGQPSLLDGGKLVDAVRAAGVLVRAAWPPMRFVHSACTPACMIADHNTTSTCSPLLQAPDPAQPGALSFNSRGVAALVRQQPQDSAGGSLQDASAARTALRMQRELLSSLLFYALQPHSTLFKSLSPPTLPAAELAAPLRPAGLGPPGLCWQEVALCLNALIGPPSQPCAEGSGGEASSRAGGGSEAITTTTTTMSKGGGGKGKKGKSKGKKGSAQRGGSSTQQPQASPGEAGEAAPLPAPPDPLEQLLRRACTLQVATRGASLQCELALTPSASKLLSQQAEAPSAQLECGFGFLYAQRALEVVQGAVDRVVRALASAHSLQPRVVSGGGRAAGSSVSRPGGSAGGISGSTGALGALATAAWDVELLALAGELGTLAAAGALLAHESEAATTYRAVERLSRPAVQRFTDCWCSALKQYGRTVWAVQQLLMHLGGKAWTTRGRHSLGLLRTHITDPLMQRLSVAAFLLQSQLTTPPTTQLLLSLDISAASSCAMTEVKTSPPFGMEVHLRRSWAGVPQASRHCPVL